VKPRIIQGKEEKRRGRKLIFRHRRVIRKELGFLSLGKTLIRLDRQGEEGERRLLSSVKNLEFWGRPRSLSKGEAPRVGGGENDKKFLIHNLRRRPRFATSSPERGHGHRSS